MDKIVDAGDGVGDEVDTPETGVVLVRVKLKPESKNNYPVSL